MMGMCGQLCNGAIRRFHRRRRRTGKAESILGFTGSSTRPRASRSAGGLAIMSLIMRSCRCVAATNRELLARTAIPLLVMALVAPRMNGASSTDYFPPSESQGGWRKLETAEEIRRDGEMDPKRLAELKQWLLDSDDRNFAADVIRHGYVVLEVERG